MNPLLIDKVASSDSTKELLKPIPLRDSDRLFIRLENEDQFFIRAFGKDKALPSLQAVGSWATRMPECDGSKGQSGEWIVAATDFNAIIIASLWRGRLKFADELSELKFNSLLAFYINGQARAVNFHAYKAGCWPTKFPYLDSEDYPVKRHQMYGVINAMGIDGYGLFMEQGTGKTPIGVNVACNVTNQLMRDDPAMKRVIIVCPNNVRLNWQIEMGKFATKSHQVTVLRGTKQKRIEMFLKTFIKRGKSEFTCLIVGYDTLKNSMEYISKVDWDLGIADESHYFKTPGNKRCKTMLKLRDKCAKRLVLTGTPITNTALDLYTQFEFMGKGYSGFNSYKAFKSYYGVYVKGESGFDKLVGLQNLPLMQERMSRLCFIVRKEEALPDLPKKVYNVEEVEMTKQQAEIYRAVATQLQMEIENDLINGKDNEQLLVNNILTKLLRLAQITSGYVVYPQVVDEEGNVQSERSTARITPNPKLEKLVEILKSRPATSKTIVWACWVEDIKAIMDRLNEEGIKAVSLYGATSFDKRQENVDAFNKDRDTKVIVSNPAAGGTGVTLLGHDPRNADEYDTNCDLVLYYSQNWSMVNRSQSEDRPHRVGTRVPVSITDLCVPETIDEEIRSRVLDKITSALEISDLRDVLSKIKI